MTSRTMSSAIAAAMVAAVGPALAVSAGMSDTFASGTTAGWGSGLANPNPPTHIPSGGPSGSGDAYLLLQSTATGGPGGKLVVFNSEQWAGDYHDAGVTAIGMDVRNFGSTDLELRLMFTGSLGATAITSNGLELQSDSGWTHLRFSLSPDNLVGSPLVLSNVAELKLFHNLDPVFPPSEIVASLGVDNITAIPEPASAALLGLGLAAIGARRQHRHSHQVAAAAAA